VAHVSARIVRLTLLWSCEIGSHPKALINVLRVPHHLLFDRLNCLVPELEPLITISPIRLVVSEPPLIVKLFIYNIEKLLPLILVSVLFVIESCLSPFELTLIGRLKELRLHGLHFR